MQLRPNGISIKDVDVNELDRLIEYLSNFKNENRGRNFWRKRLKHWWENNPGFNNSAFCGSLLMYDDGKNEKIVGFLGVIPFLTICDNTKQLSYGLTNWRVDEEFRNQSLMLLSHLLKNLDKQIIFVNTPTPEVHAIYKALKFSSFYSSHYVSHFYFKKNFFNNLTHIKSLSILTNIAHTIVNLYQNFLFNKSALDNDIRILDIEKSDYDNFLKKTINFQNLYIDRSSKIIEWIKNYNQNNGKIILGYYKNNNLKCTCTFMFCQENYKKLICVDIWGDISLNILKRFIYFVSIQKINENIDLIEIPELNPQIKKILQKTGMYKKKRSDMRLIKSPPEKYFNKNSYFTMLEGDFIH